MRVHSHEHYMPSLLLLGYRVGLEDSLWDGPGNLAKTNADQVKRVVEILNGLSLEVATPDEARQMLGLKGKDKTNIN